MQSIAWLLGGFAFGLALGALAMHLLRAARIARLEAELAGSRARLDELATARDEANASLERERVARGMIERDATRLEEALAAERRNLVEQRMQFEDARRQLVDAFRSVGSDELARLQRSLLEQAKVQQEEQRRLAEAELEQRRIAIEASVKPVRELLEKQQQALGELERSRVGAYAALQEQIRSMLGASESIRLEAGKLSAALRRSDARGRWGEVALRNLVEMAGMTEHVDYEMQVHVSGGDAIQRPDLVVRLPGGGSVVVDAKVPLEHFLAAEEPNADRAARLAEHASALRRHVDALSRKAYWQQFERSPSYVVLFVPVESALAAALAADPSLQEHALRSRVIVASSGIFLGLLQTVALFWRQERLAENARRIGEAGTELYGRLAVFAGHLTKLGDDLEKALRNYNKAIGSFESRVLPATRTLRELHAANDDPVDPPPMREGTARPIGAAELLLDAAVEESGSG
jgi:DNA recombination protein RmuC